MPTKDKTTGVNKIIYDKTTMKTRGQPPDTGNKVNDFNQGDQIQKRTTILNNDNNNNYNHKIRDYTITRDKSNKSNHHNIGKDNNKINNKRVTNTTQNARITTDERIIAQEEITAIEEATIIEALITIDLTTTIHREAPTTTPVEEITATLVEATTTTREATTVEATTTTKEVPSTTEADQTIDQEIIDQEITGKEGNIVGEFRTVEAVV